METTHVAWGALLIFPIIGLIALALTAFWIWMLIDCIKNEGIDSNEKIVWVLVIVFAHFLGSLIYFFVGRPKGRTAIPPRVT